MGQCNTVKSGSQKWSGLESYGVWNWYFACVCVSLCVLHKIKFLGQAHMLGLQLFQQVHNVKCSTVLVYCYHYCTIWLNHVFIVNVLFTVMLYIYILYIYILLHTYVTKLFKLISLSKIDMLLYFSCWSSLVFFWLVSEENLMLPVLLLMPFIVSSTSGIHFLL